MHTAAKRVIMDNFIKVAPHTEVEVIQFSEDLNIPIIRARYIEYMRAAYLSHEYDYVYTKKKGSEFSLKLIK